ncbi:MAG: sigma-54-dependent Fis family transcriptional regulator [Candidatus Binataceae bacterium]|nr:sigma-54-dependent Fis family transcriptional regulator [Candidatus Binataceae bacterium]
MPDEKRILVAEDDVATGQAWSELIASWGYRVEIAEDGQRALDLIDSYDPHILLLDLRLPEKNGLEVLGEMRERGVQIPTVMISGEGEIADAVQAIKLGAYDYLRKPVDPPHLRVLLNNLKTHLTISDENQRLRRRLLRAGELGGMIAQSAPMRRMLALIEQVAPSAASVVILGESGTGKELVARTIHELSPRRGAPYIAINCAALPETLMESEMFGHERGAFTGADRRREGCFEMANGGTLLLDEIGEMKPELQAKMLRVLEEGKLRRLGASTEVPIDVRVLASTNRNLETAIREGRFREDLYYRLNVFAIEIAPLSDRAEDIAPLAEHFLHQIEAPAGKTVSGFEAEALEVLKTYRWPGNVRQLRNVIERALIVTRGPLIGLADLPADLRRGGGSGATFEVRLGASLDDVEREVIKRTIEFAGGNKSRAAEILGISLKTLYNRLERYSGKEPHAA